MADKTHRVAVVVFVETEGVDFADASHVACAMVRQALIGGPGGRMPTPLKMTTKVHTWRGTAFDVMEVGMAAGNGYLWTEPTSKAYRQAPMGHRFEESGFMYAVEVDFNDGMSHLRGWDGSGELKVGDRVFAYTTDDTIAFGIPARIMSVAPRKNGQLLHLAADPHDRNVTFDF